MKNAQQRKGQTDLRKEYLFLSFTCQGYLRNVSDEENEGSDSAHEGEKTE